MERLVRTLAQKLRKASGKRRTRAIGRAHFTEQSHLLGEDLRKAGLGSERLT